MAYGNKMKKGSKTKMGGAITPRKKLAMTGATKGKTMSKNKTNKKKGY